MTCPSSASTMIEVAVSTPNDVGTRQHMSRGFGETDHMDLDLEASVATEGPTRPCNGSLDMRTKRYLRRQLNEEQVARRASSLAFVRGHQQVTE